MRILKALLLGTSAMTIAGAAQAQDQGAADEGTAVTEIVVTANRREEKLQDVPVTVTVVSGEQLARQNITTVENLTRATPSLDLAGPSGFGALSIRGIGSLGFSRSSEGSVGVMVDGVALANTSASPPLLFDIERVEVLEGPQGMLFGRNSSAGVINVTTAAPDPAAFEAFGTADIAERDSYIGRAAINVPLGDSAAFRAAISMSQDPQGTKNLLDGSYAERELRAVRGRFLWDASETLTVNLAADYNETEQTGGVPWAVFTSTPGSLLSTRLAACGVDVGPNNDQGCINGTSYSTAQTYGVSGQVDLAVGEFNLTSITAARRAEGTSGGDVDSTSADRLSQAVTDEIRNFSQEIRLTSPVGGRVEYVAGIYYFKTETENVTSQYGFPLADLPLIGACPLPAAFLCGLPFGGSRPTQTETTSTALFGQATFNATDSLRFILGGRLGREEVGATAEATTTAPGALAPLASVPAVNESTEDDYFSYRLGVQYDVSDDLMLFATYTKGYKGPAINDQSASATVPLIVRPEIPKSFELGAKATLLDGRAALNGTFFHTEVEDFQAQFISTAGGTPEFIYGNAPGFTVNGFTLTLFGRPMPGLTANAGLTYTSSEYDKGYFQPNVAGAIVDIGDLDAEETVKFTASAEYTRSLTSNYDGYVQVDLVRNPTTYSNAARDEVLKIESSVIVGGRVGLRTADGRFGVAIYGRNLFDEFRPSAKFATPLAAQQLDPYSFSQFTSAEGYRVIGITLEASF